MYLCIGVFYCIYCIVISAKKLSCLFMNNFVNTVTRKYHKQTWKFGRNCFVTTLFPSLIKDSNNNSFPQIHLHNTNAFYLDLTGKHFHYLYYKLHTDFLHTDLPKLHKWACFSTTILPLLIYLECSPTQCIIKK